MDKFITGAVVGFFVCYWLTNQGSTTNKDGIHFLKDRVLPRPDAGTIVSGFIAKNRSL